MLYGRRAAGEGRVGGYRKYVGMLAFCAAGVVGFWASPSMAADGAIGQTGEVKIFNWGDPANWQCGLIPGDTQGAASTTDAAAVFAEKGVEHFKVAVDQGRAVNKLSIGTGYVLGDKAGPALFIVGKGARIFPEVAGEGEVTINAPLHVTEGVAIQTSDKTPVVFNGDIQIDKGTIHVFNASGVVTFNGSLKGGGYSTNGGNARVILNGVNHASVRQDVTKMTVVLNRAGAVTDAALGAGRGGNYELAVANALTGSGSISANSAYFGTGLYGVSVLIAADNNYTGNTSIRGVATLIANPDDNIDNAVLRVNNGHDSRGSATGSGDVSVMGGVLAGDGRIANSGGNGVVLGNSSNNVAKEAGGLSIVGTAQGRLSPGAEEGVVGILSFDLGSKGLDISDVVAQKNTKALVFDLAAPGESDQVRLMGGSVLKIGDGKLEFDDFDFHASNGLKAGQYVLFMSQTVPIGGSLGANRSGKVGAFNAALSLARNNRDVVLTVSK